MGFVFLSLQSRDTSGFRGRDETADDLDEELEEDEDNVSGTELLGNGAGDMTLGGDSDDTL